MTITININTQEAITLSMMIMDRIKDCDKNRKTSLFYGDTEGENYWAKEKALAIQLQGKLDGVI